MKSPVSIPDYVYLALPHYGQIQAETVMSMFNPCRPGSNTRINVYLRGSSALTLNFNLLWAHCLDDMKDAGFTHFAMLHSDVSPDPGWLDILLDELWTHKADVVSAVIPIKDNRGVTTTGIGQHGTLNVLKRLTVRGARKLPKTFSAADAGYPDNPLLINTGCWVCRLDRPWIDQFPGFTTVNWIQRDEKTGKRIAKFFSEDWVFGLWLSANGVKVKATTAVSVAHHGEGKYRNDIDWGLENDPTDGAL